MTEKELAAKKKGLTVVGDFAYDSKSHTYQWQWVPGLFGIGGHNDWVKVSTKPLPKVLPHAASANMHGKSKLS